ncbi:ABC transporter substrate-binding protein [Candidimonas sp. SYP-B2681]|uniref:ABC transporter substrate-binding protein n=1 Tax=Candidimonas sp. SYP-B2681 TaxID=2497686 RepID=UPI000F85DAC8|nr:ABC transporter substrate-binding protein [Candidimonas sp. SYP-B2681]RTZ41472.1 ABC transporter substrate-binding protein [Candidimonas sp. SYP-B2681]
MSLLKARVTMILTALMIALPAAARTPGKPLSIYMALWRGCEAACHGFKDAIVKSGIHAVFVERNANYDRSKLAGFVEEARAMQPDLVITWGTTVTLGMAGTLKEAKNPRYITQLPLVYMIVADAVSSGIIKSFEQTGRTNITGTHHRVPEEINLNAIRTYFPAFRKLGMLYSSTETNSVVKVEEVRALTGPMNFELVAIEFDLDANGQPNVASIPEKMQALREKGVDFVYVGSSSFIERNGATFTAAALKAGLPVLSPYENLVTEADGLLAISARYYAVGELAARQARRILVDEVNPGELPVLAMTQFAFVINMKSARQLKLFPALELLQIAETVN